MKEKIEFQERPGNFATGIIWGTILSIPLWLSFFGWIKLIQQYI